MSCYSVFLSLRVYEHIERVNNPAEQGYDLIMWKQGQKIIVKYFRRVLLLKMSTPKLNR